jgi:hypothetical protein
MCLLPGVLLTQSVRRFHARCVTVFDPQETLSAQGKGVDPDCRD